MENKKKTTVFNLIILDESGSMSPLKKATISGCNETIDTVIAAQKSHSDTQNHFLSIYAFQSGLMESPSHYILQNAKGGNIRYIGKNEYEPCGGTPLYDAIGDTVSSLMEVASTHEDAVGVITIITDGYENSSCKYSHTDIFNLISRVKELGWQVNFIGANIDVEKVASGLNIKSVAKFNADADSTLDVFRKVNQQSCTMYCDMEMEASLDDEERLKKRKSRWGSFFK